MVVGGTKCSDFGKVERGLSLGGHLDRSTNYWFSTSNGVPYVLFGGGRDLSALLAIDFNGGVAKSCSPAIWPVEKFDLIDLEGALFELGSPPSGLFVRGMDDALLVSVQGIGGLSHVVGGVA